MSDLKQQATQARLKVLEMIYKAKSSHIGSNFSVIDILTVLFNKVDFTKDKIILSAGWKAAAFYYFLAEAGFFPKEWLNTYNQEGSKLIGLTEPGVPGVYFAGGSMQMGLPAAVGFALSKKMKGEDGKVYCIMSDGEIAGGMIYESALIAAHHKLDNLIVFVDRNGFQAMGDTYEILFSTFPSVGWEVYESEGHNFDSIEMIWKSNSSIKRPTAYLFNTVKGKGVSFMENNNLWHYKDIDEDSYRKAAGELSFGIFDAIAEQNV